MKSVRVAAAVGFMLSLCCAAEAEETRTVDHGLEWHSRVVLQGGRIDAVAWLGDGVVVAGSRSPHAGKLFRTTDLGQSWSETALDAKSPKRAPSVTCIASDRSATAYLLTSTAHVWKSTDRGATWLDLGRVLTGVMRGSSVQSYGLVVLPSGTVLVSDTNRAGGHVHRSADGGQTWEDCGEISSDRLYRFELTTDAVLVNGWAGRVFRSCDDGRSWSDQGRLSERPLYATLALHRGVVLQASGAGEVFRSSDAGQTWSKTADVNDPADDFADLGKGNVLLSTYSGKRALYLSHDSGLTWAEIGVLPTGVEGDVLDHAVSATDKNHTWMIGTSKLGALARVRCAP
jgi:photosystem II stability/assembly factor-like uncharacterized protein